MVAPTAGDRRLAVAAALAVVYVVWGSTYVGIAVAIESLPPLLMAGVRFVLAGAVLYVVASRFGERGRGRPGARQWTAAAATGIPLFLLGNGGVVWAQQTVPSGIAALVVATVPLWIVLLDRLAFGSRLPLRVAAGIGIGFGGVALLVDLRGTGGVDAVGATTLVLASAAWALGSLLSQRLALPERPLVAASMQMLAGGAATLVVGVAAGELDSVRVTSISARSLAAVAYLVAFGSIVAFSAYTWLLRNARTSVVATYAYVNPVVAVLLGSAVLGEEITARTLVAGGLIVAAVAIIVSARAAPAAPVEATAPALRETVGRPRAVAGTRGR